ncbi:TadE-like protein [Filomicrobium insigne]|uniref:TadE-like protein n=1 Tax=Filomicrobium insigne TaxID=418854 RepID=A0A1H0H198_9HYPH|nr:TadE/TadG family type IV pilus assembly protein [Filomicrobium insigne]SDO12824.1 TadE-like protein [Filomicrobium insigne]
MMPGFERFVSLLGGRSAAGAPIRAITALFRKAGLSTSGAAAVEFAVIAPLLLVLLMVVVEGSRAIELDRRFNLVTSMAGDLVSREQDMGSDPAATVKGIMNVIDHVMGVGQGDTLEVEIIPVMGFGTDGTDTRTYAPAYKREKDGSITVSKPKCTPYELPPGIVTEDSTAIVVKSSYRYIPMAVTKTAFPPMTWEQTATHSPRHGCVDFQGNNCAVSCQ